MKIKLFSKIAGLFRGGNAYEAARNPEPSIGYSGTPADASAELDMWSRAQLVAKVRGLEKNSPIVRELLNTISIFTVGDGMNPQPRSADEAWNASARAWFLERFAPSADATRRFSFRALQNFACRLLFVDGECFFVKTERDGRPALQMLETHHVSSRTSPEERLVCGVFLDAYGAPVAYEVESSAGRVRVPAAEMIHVAAWNRPSELRPAPQLAHVVSHVNDYLKTLKLKKDSVKLQSSIALKRKSEQRIPATRSLGLGSGVALNAPASESAEANANKLSRVLGVGVFNVGENEELDTLGAKDPAQEWQSFMKTLKREACEGSIQYEIASDASEIGGAGVRLVVGKAARFFERVQQELIEQLLNEAWKFAVGWAIAHGELAAADGWWRVEWSIPRKITVDAGRDEAQTRASVLAGLIPVRDYQESGGWDPDAELAARLALIKKVNALAEREGVDARILFPALYGGIAQTQLTADSGKSLTD